MWRLLWSRWLPAAALAAVVSGITARSVLLACGGGFPNRLLVEGDKAVRSAPCAVFSLELGSIIPPEKSELDAVPPGKG